jgi:spore coat protein U-like protein
MRRVLAAILLLPLAPSAAHAACTSLTITNLAFGSYTGAALPMTATVTATCSAGFAYSVGLSAGSGTVSARTMESGAASLGYGLFQDAAHSINWGNTAGTDTLAETGTGAAQALTIHGQVPASQRPTPETYTDTNTATIYSASGGPSNPTMAVTATVAPACTIAATNLAFGTYSGALANAVATLTVTCTDTTLYNIGLGAGLASGATVTTRQMTGSGSTTLAYALYQDGAHSINWGVTVGTDTVAGTGNGIGQPVSVYGQIAAGQFPVPGSYSDTIVATVTY